MGNIDQCRLWTLPKVDDPRGSLVYLQRTNFLDFQINRVYYLFDLETNSARGGHAHFELDQLIIAVSGSMVINLDDGKNKKSVLLNDPGKGLRVSSMIWRDINEISSNAVCLVLASNEYDERDYIRDYETFIKIVKNGSKVY